jgi:hypothetical protein
VANWVPSNFFESFSESGIFKFGWTSMLTMPLAQRVVAAALVASVFFYASSWTRAECICRKVGNGTWNGRNNQNDRIGHWGRVASRGWAFHQRFSRQRLWGHLWEIELGTIVMKCHVLVVMEEVGDGVLDFLHHRFWSHDDAVELVGDWSVDPRHHGVVIACLVGVGWGVRVP